MKNFFQFIVLERGSDEELHSRCGGCARFVNRANDGTHKREFEHVADAAEHENFHRQRLDREADEIKANEDQDDLYSEFCAGAGTTVGNKASVSTGKKEGHDRVTENERSPLHVVVRAVMRCDFHVGRLHENAVPDKPEKENENECRNECDEEFYPVHSFLVEVS